jgi:organic radical activating enzyme
MSSIDDHNKNKKKFDGRKLSQTICILPFTSLSVHATGHVTSCQMTEDSAGEIGTGNSPIQIWQGEKLSKLREDMKDGVQSKNCENCHKKEIKSLKSKRLHWQQLKLVKDLWTNEDIFTSEVDNSIYHLDIAFNNYCNFKCRMCSSSYSSQWVQDEKVLKENGMLGGSGGMISKTATRYDKSMNSLSEKDLRGIVSHCKDVRRIEILGGEPFLTKEFDIFLDLCAEYDIGTNTEIMITTNGSTIKEEMLEKLSSFKYVNLNISVDGTGNHFEYIRSSGSLSWNKLSQNINYFLNFANQKNKTDSNKCWKINLNGAYQAYNMLNFEKFIDWIVDINQWKQHPPVENSKYRHSFEHRILMGPRHLSIFAAPNNLVKIALKQLNIVLSKYPFLKNISEGTYLKDIETALEKSLSEPLEKKETLWTIFCQYTQLLDRTRQEDLSCLSPDLYSSYQDWISGPVFSNKTKEWKKSFTTDKL